MGTGSADPFVRVFTTGSEQPRWLQEQGGPVLAVAAGPDVRRIASASANGTVLLLDVSNDGHVLQQVFRPGAVRGVALGGPNGEWLAMAGADGTTLVVNTTNSAERPLTPHVGPVHAIAVSPDGQSVGTAGEDGSVHIGDTVTGTERLRVDLAGPAVDLAVAYDSTGAWVAAGMADGTARVLGD